MNTAIKALTLFSTLPIVARGVRDPLGLLPRHDDDSSLGYVHRELLTGPLVVPENMGSFDCYFDDLCNDNVCYFDKHDYSQSHFVASCASATFHPSTCSCELSTEPDEGMENNFQSGVFTYQQCVLCHFVETNSGGWAVEYDCTNIVSGAYAAHQTSTLEQYQEDVTFEEDAVIVNNANPEDLFGDSNHGGSLGEDSVATGNSGTGGAFGEDSVLDLVPTWNSGNGNAFGEDSVPDNIPSPAPSNDVILTMYKVTRPPTSAPGGNGRRNAMRVDENKVRRRLSLPEE